MRIDFQSIALGKAVTFETKQLKHFVLKFRSERSTFVKILQNLRIEIPVQLRNFQEEEGSFETNHGQKDISGCFQPKDYSRGEPEEASLYCHWII